MHKRYCTNELSDDLFLSLVSVSWPGNPVLLEVGGHSPVRGSVGRASALNMD